MVRYLTVRLRPSKGFSHLLHISLVALVPLLVLILVRLDLVGAAAILIFLSKWRMLSVKPRFWLAHVRTNAVDLIVSFSLLVFMISTASLAWQLVWLALYELWLLAVKPGTKPLAISVQALLAQLAGLTAIFLALPEASTAVYMVLVGLVAYFSARHFFSAFEEPHGVILSTAWAMLSVNIMWVLGHWLLFLGALAMPAIVITTLGYGFATLYYLKETNHLTIRLKNQLYFLMLAVSLILVVWLVIQSNLEL